MMDLQLNAVANQSFATSLDGARFEIVIKSAENCMCVDITRDNVLLVTGLRVLPDYPLIPYKYLATTAGNFIFVTENDELPDWTKFGTTQFLAYVTAEEIAALVV